MTIISNVKVYEGVAINSKHLEPKYIIANNLDDAIQNGGFIITYEPKELLGFLSISNNIIRVFNKLKESKNIKYLVNNITLADYGLYEVISHDDANISNYIAFVNSNSADNALRTIKNDFDISSNEINLLTLLVQEKAIYSKEAFLNIIRSR